MWSYVVFWCGVPLVSVISSSILSWLWYWCWWYCAHHMLIFYWHVMFLGLCSTDCSVNISGRGTCSLRSWDVTHFLVPSLPEASFGLRVLSLPLSVRLSVTKFVRAITHHPFKLGSPNLDQRCKTPWFRSLLFWGPINLDLQGQI